MHVVFPYDPSVQVMVSCFWLFYIVLYRGRRKCKRDLDLFSGIFQAEFFCCTGLTAREHTNPNLANFWSQRGEGGGILSGGKSEGSMYEKS